MSEKIESDISFLKNKLLECEDKINSICSVSPNHILIKKVEYLTEQIDKMAGDNDFLKAYIYKELDKKVEKRETIKPNDMADAFLGASISANELASRFSVDVEEIWNVVKSDSQDIKLSRTIFAYLLKKKVMMGNRPINPTEELLLSEIKEGNL